MPCPVHLHTTETDSTLKSSSFASSLNSLILSPPSCPRSFPPLPLSRLLGPSLHRPAACPGTPRPVLDFIHNGHRERDSPVFFSDHFIFALGYLVMDRKRSSRSGSPQPKRPKLSHDATPSQSSPTADPDGTTKSGADPYAENLASGLLRDENVDRLREEYANSQPYKYARIEALFQDDLLKKVKDECLAHLSFTEKETDIYRVSAPVYAVSGPDLRPLRVHHACVPCGIPARGTASSPAHFVFLTGGPTPFTLTSPPIQPWSAELAPLFHSCSDQIVNRC